MDLLPPDELTRLYIAGEIDLETLVLETLHHIMVLQGINELQKIVLNGLLNDVKAIAEELDLERPSAASRARLKAWIRQVEEFAGPLVDGDVPRSDEAASPGEQDDLAAKFRSA
jgi:hypothetical protein